MVTWWATESNEFARKQLIRMKAIVAVGYLFIKFGRCILQVLSTPFVEALSVRDNVRYLCNAAISTCVTPIGPNQAYYIAGERKR